MNKYKKTLLECTSLQPVELGDRAAQLKVNRITKKEISNYILDFTNKHFKERFNEELKKDYMKHILEITEENFKENNYLEIGDSFLLNPSFFERIYYKNIPKLL